MPHADPSQMWEPADPLDELLYDVWRMALDASGSDDQQEEIHDCSVCGDPHGTLDEAKYVDIQRAYLTNARGKLDALLVGEGAPAEGNREARTPAASVLAWLNASFPEAKRWRVQRGEKGGTP